MPRLFVAIELPSDVKDRLVQLQTAIPTARWVKPEHMHLTLRFIGEMPDRQVRALTSALETIEPPGFDLHLSGVGRFPPQEKRAPRVLWVGIAAQPALEELHRRIEKTLVSVGCEPDDRAFHAHITLARLKTQKPLHQVSDFLKARASFNIPPFPVTHFALVNSVLSSQGPTYTNEAIYRLSKPA